MASAISVSSLSEYHTLQSFAAAVSDKSKDIANGTGIQGLHLAKFLDSLRRRTWIEIKDQLSA
jgi:hypothetical protein